MTDGQSSLTQFAEDCGTTDDPRETVPVGDPEDGHNHRVGGVDPYWGGERKLDEFDTWPCYSLVPAGRFTIVLDDDAQLVEHGWPNDQPIERGVYLSGRDQYGSRPPKPVVVSDAHLKFAAEAALRAADQICPDERVVAVSKSSWGATLIVGIDASYDQFETVFDGGGDHVAGAYPREQPELFAGFYYIRKRGARGTTFDVYTDAEAPRLRLSDLDWTIGQAGDA